MNQAKTVREIHEVSRRIGRRTVSRDEARSIISEVATDPRLDISARRTPTVVAADVRRELASSVGLDEDDLLYPRPEHYRSNTSGIEVIDVARHLGFCLGNAVKFIGRAGEEGGVSADLEKAMFYLDDASENLAVVPVVDWTRSGVDIDAYLDGQEKVGGCGRGTRVHDLVTGAQRLFVSAVEAECDDPTAVISAARAMISEALSLLIGGDGLRFRIHVDTELTAASVEAADLFVELDRRPDVSVTYLPEGIPLVACAALVGASAADAQLSIWVSATDPAQALSEALGERGRGSILPFHVKSGHIDSSEASALRGMLR